MLAWAWEPEYLGSNPRLAVLKVSFFSKIYLIYLKGSQRGRDIFILLVIQEPGAWPESLSSVGGPSIGVSSGFLSAGSWIEN